MENNSDILLIQQYLKGELNPRQMHELEKQSLDDPFLADALEGYTHAHNSAGQLSILQRQLEERIAAQQEEKSVFNFTWQRLSIAAAAGLMFISAGILFLMNANKTDQRLTANAKKVHVQPLSPVPGTDKTTVALADTLSMIEQQQKTAGLNKSSSRPRTKNTIVRSVPQTVFETQSGIQTTDTNNPSAESLSDIAILGRTVSQQKTNGSGTAEVKTLKIGAGNLSGKVISSDGSPLPGAVIKVKGSTFTTATNKDGEFVLPDSLAGTVIASSLGYKQKEFNIKAGDNAIVAMEVSTESLNEVVVTSRGNALAKKEAGKPGAPQIGWKEYNEYLIANTAKLKTRLANADKVVVTFSVGEKGRLQDFQISRSINASCDAEAIRLIKKGPKWTPSATGKPYQAIVEVNFPAK